jgi:hypothetical protein
VARVCVRPMQSRTRASRRPANAERRRSRKQTPVDVDQQPRNDANQCEADKQLDVHQTAGSDGGAKSGQVFDPLLPHTVHCVDPRPHEVEEYEERPPRRRNETGEIVERREPLAVCRQRYLNVCKVEHN